ncbi:MAG: alpha/beta hydrolase [Planctomycetia bacterium]|nr:alpha/beta hydrolase [Planctomycetia bacterium]
MIWWIVFLILAVLRWYIYRQDIKRLGETQARRRVVQGIFILLTVYLGILALLLGFESKLVYHPLSPREYWLPPPGVNHQEVKLKSSTGDEIHAWWCEQANAKFTILFSHGNAGNLSNHAWIIPELRKAFPCNVLIYDYPGFGYSTGKPGEAACYASAEAAYTWLLQEKKVPATQLILMGQSLGCAMACELASHHDHQALVLLSPFTTIRDLGQELMPIFPVRWLMGHRYDNRSKLEKLNKPLLIGHGTADEVIPFHHGQKLFDASASKSKKFHTIKGGTHNEFSPDYFVAVKQFLDELP